MIKTFINVYNLFDGSFSDIEYIFEGKKVRALVGPISMEILDDFSESCQVEGRSAVSISIITAGLDFGLFTVRQFSPSGHVQVDDRKSADI